MRTDPDVHPEAFCDQCGRPNIRAWWSPEWNELVDWKAAILCPVCFAALDPGAVWKLTRSAVNGVPITPHLFSALPFMDLTDDAAAAFQQAIDDT